MNLLITAVSNVYQIGCENHEKIMQLLGADSVGFGLLVCVCVCDMPCTAPFLQIGLLT